MKRKWGVPLLLVTMGVWLLYFGITTTQTHFWSHGLPCVLAGVCNIAQGLAIYFGKNINLHTAYVNYKARRKSIRL